MSTPADRGVSPGRRPAPLILVVVAIAFNLWALRAESSYAAPLNDDSVHQAMVRWAADRISSGHLPLDGWFADLDFGFPQFHHYQSLSHSLTGAVGAMADPDTTFAWTNYLLLSLWPIAVYGSTRMFGFGAWAAAAAALLSPLVASAPSFGFEYESYTWRGWGLFPQLWAMWTLPFAWAAGYRAVARRGSMALAAVLIALTMALHFLTGYLALAALGVWTMVGGSGWARRLGRAVMVGGGALLAAAWVVVPVILDRGWTHGNVIHPAKYADSFGARRALSWLVTGQLFDAGRWALITPLVAVGIVVCLRRDRQPGRAVLGVFAVSLLLFFGRPTFGGLLDLVPFGGEILYHRFISGVHMAGIVLAGIGAAALGRWAYSRLRERVRGEPALLGVLMAAAILGLTPAWMERDHFNDRGAVLMDEQREADRTDGADFAALVAIATERGDGRIYAGTPNNWGADYRIGQVPAHIELLNNDADGVGFLYRTLALSSDVAALFDDTDSAQYAVFGIRYLIVPDDRPAPVPSHLVERRGRHVLWEVERGTGYLSAVDSSSYLAANRDDLGLVVAPFLRDAASGSYPLITFPGVEPGPIAPAGAAAQLDTLTADPERGRFVAAVRSDRPVNVLLRATFHGRWVATVDGAPAPIHMVAPSFVGVAVPAGDHRVTFDYRSIQYYWLLFLVGVLSLATLTLTDRLIGRPPPAER